MNMIHISVPGHPEATLDGYILDCELSLGQSKKRPAIVVCPGGGYVYCSPREGEPVALAYAAQGFHAFVLHYSTGWDCLGFSPLQEISWVIGYLRENAEQWNIDPEKIISCGFSAGGHLALSSGLLGENKPNAMILGYPCVSIPSAPGADFMLRFFTGKQTVAAEDAVPFDLPSKITSEAPPVFLFATAEDALTAHGALPVAQKYSDLGLHYELHIFQHGPHGYSLANEVAADGSSQVLNPAFARWMELSVAWIYRIFGANTFTDRSTSKMAGYLTELGFDLQQKKDTSFA